MNRTLPFLLSVVLGGCAAAAPSAVLPVGHDVSAAPFCGAEPLPAGAPDADLHCVRLEPRPDWPEARAWGEMRPAPSPFGVAVDRDGVHLWDITVRAEGLPEPVTVDSGAATFVAWATGANLHPEIRLGEVGAGDEATGRIALDRFMVLVSAEASPEVEERSGPIVLRGTSPSMRMLPHEAPWLFTPDPHHHHPAPDPGADAEHQLHAHGQHLPHDPAPLEWRPPPMHPAVVMPAGIGALRPSVEPFLPHAAHEEVPEVRPTEVVSLADGDTLELVAAPVRRTIAGRSHVLYGFNRQIPGPLIRAERNAEVVIRVRNETAFPTAVHWHGIRLENRFDGVPGVTQDPVLPGESFTYHVRVPDPGLFWYHPHLREDATQGLGLYGNLRVDADGAGDLPPVHREETWVLDDLLLGTDGGLFPFGREATTHALMGRFGNVLLVNGGVGETLEVDRGEVVRFLLTNVAAVRPFNLVFEGATARLVAGDLSPFAREETVESVPIAPAERYIVDVRFDQPGEHAVTNRVRGIDHLAGAFFADVDTLAVVRVRDRDAAPLERDFDVPRENADISREVAPLLAHLDRAPDRELLLTQEIGPLPFPLRPMMQMDSAYFHPVEWSGTMPDMDWIPTANEVRWILRDPATGRENHEIDWRFREGDLVRLRIRNEREVLHAMYHPIHLHGQRFLVLAMNGVPNPNPVWKDTFVLPVGWTAELLVEMSNPGDWMLHCHISEHLESGMHAVFRVDPREGEWEGWRGFSPGDPIDHHAEPHQH